MLIPSPVRIRALVVAIACACANAAIADPVADRERAAVRAANNGEFAAAAEIFESLYQETRSLRYLFAWAQSERHAGNCAEAVRLFRSYLDTGPTDKNRAAVEEALASEDLTACQTDQADASETTNTTDSSVGDDAAEQADDTEQAASDRSEAGTPLAADVGASSASADAGGRHWLLDPLGASLAIGGMSAVAAGGYLFWSGRAAVGDAESEPTYDEFYDRAQAGYRRRNIGLIVGGAGVALVSAAAIRYALVAGDDDDKPSPVAASASFAAGRLGVSLAWRY